jgi:hypothetical protein
MSMRLRQDTPLWPAGHLPHKGGDQLGAPFCLAQKQSDKRSSDRVFLRKWFRAKASPLVISPLVGEMAGRPEGGWHGTTLDISGATP